MSYLNMRGWDKTNKVMGYLDHPFDENWYTIPCVYGESPAQIAFTNEWKGKKSPDNIVLMLHTGLADKNGKEVYESDVIRHDAGYGHIVDGIVRFGKMPQDSNPTYQNVGFYIEWQNDGSNTWNDWWRHDIAYWILEKECEVIGNICEDPEVIKDN